MTGADWAWLFASAAAVLIAAMICATYLMKPWE